MTTARHTPTPSLGTMLREMRGMNYSEMRWFVRRKVLSLRFCLLRKLRSEVTEGRFNAEDNLVRDLICCTTVAELDQAAAEYRRHPARISGALALLLGCRQPRSITVYFLGLEQRWRWKNRV